ncbi:hypothetical protein phiYS61_35 [Weissella phage phiYS61]|uniref:hypothetical protein n=1 Tax=Weissella phage phiYS61 TaxID=1161906 RepID=UPI000274E24A|nr:hypothetical protein phiYS61_35 [Weissella phage phiYS61]AFF27993.1 hypothetical protein phiYS61_35 [Weissella phage phiYS61]
MTNEREWLQNNLKPTALVDVLVSDMENLFNFSTGEFDKEQFQALMAWEEADNMAMYDEANADGKADIVAQVGRINPNIIEGLKEIIKEAGV